MNAKSEFDVNIITKYLRIRGLLFGLLAILVMAAGCSHDDPIRPEGYAFGPRVKAPFTQMIANAHPEPVELESVYFEYDSYDLTPEAKKSLAKTALAIRKNGRPVFVLGHTDYNNTEDFNHRLGLDRAVHRAELPMGLRRAEGMDDSKNEGQTGSNCVQFNTGRMRVEPQS